MFAIARFCNGAGRAVIDVTASGAVLEFGHGITSGRRCFGFLVRIGLEIAGVTTGAESRIRTESPGNHFIITGMTATTGDAAIVRAVGRTGVRITNGCPVGRGMTSVARA